jgi:5-methylcytosine-specific restriction endonuclease McrA
MTRALVLNVSYEALSVVSTRRALSLILCDKAELLHDTGSYFHSERQAFPEPSVVRLLYFVKVPFPKRVALTKRAVFARDSYRCQYCGAPAENIDHVVPRSRGGSHSWDNVVASCKPCNARKEDRLLHETNFVLKRMPGQPRAKAWIWLLGNPREDWLPFIGESSLSA